jgi:hypothetical protein
MLEVDADDASNGLVSFSVETTKQQHSQNDEDEQEFTIERDDTVETTDLQELEKFVHNVNASENGSDLFQLVNTLPKVNSSTSQGHTKTRILKYLQVKSLLPESLKGKELCNVYDASIVFC